MGRNVQLQFLRGAAANIPVLEDGEFYLATDKGQLYVGLFGINFKLGPPIMANVTVAGNANPTHYIEPNADGSIVVEGPAGAAVALDGSDGTGISQPTGGTGIRGWLSGIYKALTGTLTTSVTGTVGVTGTFYQPTQPISASTLPLPSNAAQETGGNLTTIVSNLTNGTAKSQTVSSTGTVQDVTAKGTQGTSFSSTQDAKDSGRTYVILYVDRIAGVTTEALVTMSINKAGTVTTGTTYTVTAGKTFRIQSINAEILNTTTTVNRVLIRLRSGATVTVTSPVVGMAMASAQAALAAAGDTDPHSFPDGLEIAGGQQVGISQLCSVTTAGVVSAIVVGYEY